MAELLKYFCKFNSKENQLEEIDKALSLAKLEPSNIHPHTQVISFTSNELHNNHFKLLQLDANLIEQFTKSGTIHIKGLDDENAVICTETSTFEVLETETSNSLLLVENLKFKNDVENIKEKATSEVTVHSMFYDYLELVPVKPRFQRLHELLNETVYKGPEHEDEINIESVRTYTELLNSVQASKEELDLALSRLQIVMMNGKVRKLDFEYHFRVLSHMLKLIEENSWALDEIDYEETMNALDDFIPSEVLTCLFDLYTEKSKIIDALQLYRYREEDICRFFARVLLYNAGKFNFQDFLQAWQESVPEGMETDLAMLQGIAIIDKTSVPNVIYAFEEETLPENILKRFELLFHAKNKWTVPEITPYIQRMASAKTDVSAILAKYARASTHEGVKYYSAKHAK
ncbi:hypothetical protein FQA39_LY07289 [Lamprigera yunnana]|nr:hypothetical protein FQA39_LY07289 [Lamprigera yunnana]